MQYTKYFPVSNASQVLIESQPFFSVLFNDSPDAIFILDGKDYSIIECNEKALAFFEAKSKSSLINLSAFRLFDNEPVEFSKNISEFNVKNQGEYTQELAFRTLKQNVFWGKLNKYLIKVEKEGYIVLRISKANDYLNTEETLSTLLRGTAKVTGLIFFKELSRLLCINFHVKYALVGKLSNDKKTFQILEYCGPFKDIHQGNYDVKNSLFENVLNGYTTFYPEETGKLFRNDEFVKQNNVTGFMGTPVFGSSGEVVGMVAFMDDKPIQEAPNSRYILSIFASRTAAELQRIRSKEILKEQARKLATSDSIKDRLLSIIAHDLKNPLHSVMGFSELLKYNIEKFDKKNITDRIDIIDNAIRDVYFLLENLSDWSHIFSGDMQQTSNSISLRQVLDENILFFHSKLKGKKVNVQAGLDKCPLICGDFRMVNSIVRNILSNAVRYAPCDSEIFVTYALSGNYIKLSLQDSGPGIPGKKLKQILQKEKEVHEINLPDEKTIGLGLSLSKKFIKRIGGKLKIDSHPKKGTTVTVSFPKA
ncbi:MAG: ATP-binding protein [Bacteroidales bacterium]|jgi:signal transduction histidine kinase